MTVDFHFRFGLLLRCEAKSCKVPSRHWAEKLEIILRIFRDPRKSWGWQCGASHFRGLLTGWRPCARAPTAQVRCNITPGLAGCFEGRWYSQISRRKIKIEFFFDRFEKLRISAA